MILCLSKPHFSNILIYPTRSATWNLDRAKAPGIVDLKSPHIVNMGRLKIDDPRELIAQVQIQVHDRVGYSESISLQPSN